MKTKVLPLHRAGRTVWLLDCPHRRPGFTNVHIVSFDAEDDSDNWLGAPAAAEYLGVGLRTVYKLIDEGCFPAYKLGRVIRIRKADVDAYLEANKVPPGSLAHLYPPYGQARREE